MAVESNERMLDQKTGGFAGQAGKDRWPGDRPRGAGRNRGCNLVRTTIYSVKKCLIDNI